MLLERSEHNDNESQQFFIEALYDSSNIMKSIYLPDKKMLYIIFKKGIVYSYGKINNETYIGFENADSQGVYFSKNIAKNPQCSYFREYKLFDFEKKDMLKLIEEHKQLLEEKNKS